jgi:hypothetical protein
MLGFIKQYKVAASESQGGGGMPGIEEEDEQKSISFLYDIRRTNLRTQSGS